MAKQGEDYDALFKLLIVAFFLEYLQLFYPNLLPLLDLKSVEWINKELIFEFTESTKTRRYNDLVAKIRLSALGLLRYPKKSHLIFSIETEKGDLGDLRPRMPVYFIGLSVNNPDDVVIVTGLYIDTMLEGIGIDRFSINNGQLPAPAPIAQANVDSIESKFFNASQSLNPECSLVFQWRYVGLPALPVQVYLEEDAFKDNNLLPGLIGFMNTKGQNRLELQAKGILRIDQCQTSTANKNLLVRALLAGMDLNEEETQEFKRFISEHPQFRRADSVIKTWFEQGEETAARRMILRQLSKRLQTMTKAMRDNVEANIRAMSLDQIEALSEDLSNSSKTLKELGLTEPLPV